MKRISVYIITYNQEDVIRRSLESILKQKKWGLYRIVVSDDCSKDKTWSILQEYQVKYPDIVEVHRNVHNIGIYPNVQKAVSYLPESDLYCCLAGDDEYCDGYFEAVQKLVDKENVDTDKAIGIYSDWKFLNPDGSESIFKQDAVLSGHRLWSLKARGKISKRSLMWTKKVFEGFEPILEGRGLNLTESHYDAQVQLNIERAYYIPIVTTIYYAGIGVSKRLNIKESDYLTTQVIEKWNYAKDRYVHNQCDLHYAQFEIQRAYYYMNPSLKLFFRMAFNYIKGQLPGCRNALKNSVILFIRLARYGITKKIV